MTAALIRPTAEGARCCCLEWAENQPGHWRGRAKIRLEMAQSLGASDPAADHHLRMAREFERKADEVARANAHRPAGETLVVAATDVVGGELVVLKGDVLGPVIARFPRTAEGHRRAMRLAAGEG